MNSVKVYRLKWFYRYFFAILLVILINGPVLFYGWSSPWSMFASSRWSEMWGLYLALIGAFALFATLIIYIFMVNWKARLVLEEHHLSFKTIPHLLLKPFRCAYADIVRVERAEVGVLRVIPPHGQPLVISLAAYEGKAEDLLAELHQRIGRAKFETVSLTQLNRKDSWDKFFIVCAVIYLVIAIAYFYTNLAHPLVLSNVAWRSFGEIPAAHRVETLTVGPNSDVWVSLWDVFGDRYLVQRVTANGNTGWELPFAADLFFDEPRAVAFSQTGNPAVVLRNGEAWRWDGQNWQSVIVPNAPEHTYSAGLATNGSKIWVVGQNETDQSTLIQLDADSGQAQTVSLPETVTNEGWGLETLGKTTKQAALVRVRKEKLVRFFLWENAQWQEVGSELAQQRFLENSFGLLANGQLWTISLEVSTDNEGYALWVYDDDCRWQSYQIPIEQATSNFQLDESSRLWVAQREGMEVFEIVSTGELKSIVRYTEENSGYKFSYATGLGQLTLDADGYLWVFDDTLTRIDTKNIHLPAPLPNWIIPLTNRLVWAVLTGVVAVLMAVAVLIRNQRLSKIKAQ